MKSNLLSKTINIFSNRLTKLWPYFRQYWLFIQTKILMTVFKLKPKNVILGKNVRIQSTQCISCENSAFLKIDDNTIIYEKARIESYGNGKIELGKSSIIGDAIIHCRESIKIGENFLTSWNVFISDFDAHPVKSSLRQKQMNFMCSNFRPAFDGGMESSNFNWDFTVNPIVIGNNVWVGANVTILKGANIGSHSVIASGAVVLKGEYPDFSLIAGNPAKVVKTLS